MTLAPVRISACPLPDSGYFRKDEGLLGVPQEDLRGIWFSSFYSVSHHKTKQNQKTNKKPNQKTALGATEMAQWVKVLAAKPENMGLIPEPTEVSCTLTYTCSSWHLHITSPHTKKTKCNLKIQKLNIRYSGIKMVRLKPAFTHRRSKHTFKGICLCSEHCMGL